MRNKILGGFLLAVATMISGAEVVGATSAQIGDNVDSPQSIVIRRRVEGVTNSVSNTFSYQISADEENPAGVDNLPDSLSVTFNAVMPDENNIASVSAQLDFSDVVFHELGDYKFLIREISSSNSDTYPVDAEHNYCIYAYVRNEIVNGWPTGNYVATLVMQVRQDDASEKVDAIFSSKARFTYLKVSKRVSGNMASTDEYFMFTVTMDNAPAGDRYVINGQDATVVYNGETIATQNEFIAGEENVIYLKHGQVATIGLSGELMQLQNNTNYRVTEVVTNGYSVTTNGARRNHTGYAYITLPADDSGELPSSNIASFVNLKESTVLTGITIGIIPVLVLAVLCVTGYVIARKLRIGEK